MKAVLNDIVLADAPDSDLISIEGNWYFPPSSIAEGVLVESPTPYTCPWKGECQYFSVQTGDGLEKDKAWSYPHPYPTAFDRVGKDFSRYVAFDRSVRVSD
ncbi:DUF427 domain-containing protein [Rathayibacter tritici]|uniref:DUF427 domain-containing protein n=1 Tax=Rathayibacter tritici TaxID=33888 RepID=UPI00082A135F|nr:DUF427 domain-containing protein [Rathayibacter tritici]PPI45455.1 nucleotidyltransferase domain-containing protein [Rathayibacter tritici]